MKQTNESKDKVLEMTEVFNTTPQRLYKAWTNEKDFAAWFGPEGFKVIYCKLDVKIGGLWRAGITKGDGVEYWMEGKYIELVEGKKLVFTYCDGRENKDLNMNTVVTITFSKSGDQTIMNFNQSVFPTTEYRESHYGGWSSAFICLRKQIVISN